MRSSIIYIAAIARVFDEIKLSDIEEALTAASQIGDDRLLSPTGSKVFRMPKEIILIDLFSVSLNRISFIKFLLLDCDSKVCSLNPPHPTNYLFLKS